MAVNKLWILISTFISFSKYTRSSVVLTGVWHRLGWRLEDVDTPIWCRRSRSVGNVDAPIRCKADCWHVSQMQIGQESGRTVLLQSCSEQTGTWRILSLSSGWPIRRTLGSLVWLSATSNEKCPLQNLFFFLMVSFFLPLSFLTIHIPSPSLTGCGLFFTLLAEDCGGVPWRYFYMLPQSFVAGLQHELSCPYSLLLVSCRISKVKSFCPFMLSFIMMSHYRTLCKVLWVPVHDHVFLC